ncbi:hypothetical protein HMI55_003600 [Coelomomyces lativittatus]|nr:hypothetical protein HMI55_003600 [Coelomomyces lativittatus]
MHPHPPSSSSSTLPTYPLFINTTQLHPPPATKTKTTTLPPNLVIHEASSTQPPPFQPPPPPPLPPSLPIPHPPAYSPTYLTTPHLHHFKQACVQLLKGMVQLYPTLLLDEPCLESSYSPTLVSPLSGYVPQLALPKIHGHLKTCMVHANALCTQVMNGPISEQAFTKLHTCADTTVGQFKRLYFQHNTPHDPTNDPRKVAPMDFLASSQRLPHFGTQHPTQTTLEGKTDPDPPLEVKKKCPPETLALAFVRAFGEFATCVLELTDSFIHTGMLLTSQERPSSTSSSLFFTHPPTYLPPIPTTSPLLSFSTLPTPSSPPPPPPSLSLSTVPPYEKRKKKKNNETSSSSSPPTWTHPPPPFPSPPFPVQVHPPPSTSHGYFPPHVRNPYVNVPVSTARYVHAFGVTRVDLLNEYTSTCGICLKGFRMLEKKVVCKGRSSQVEMKEREISSTSTST